MLHFFLKKEDLKVFSFFDKVLMHHHSNHIYTTQSIKKIEKKFKRFTLFYFNHTLMYSPHL
jgi:hypothetical protein